LPERAERRRVGMVALVGRVDAVAGGAVGLHQRPAIGDVGVLLLRCYGQGRGHEGREQERAETRHRAPRCVVLTAHAATVAAAMSSATASACSFIAVAASDAICGTSVASRPVSPIQSIAAFCI